MEEQLFQWTPEVEDFFPTLHKALFLPTNSQAAKKDVPFTGRDTSNDGNRGVLSQVQGGQHSNRLFQ
jgi:hypothetical protein